MDDSLVGKTFGKYRIEELIGRGAMAEVYRAYHTSLKRQVAIKRLHPFLLEKADMLDRFQREAQNIAALSHPNIVQVYDFDASESIYYMVMELINGDTLKGILKDAQTVGNLLPLDESIRIARDVCTALGFAHAHQVIHRDVKPANIMRDRSGRIVLADFGLARLLSGPQYTSTGTIIGTPAYISPEQGSGLSGDERSDLYALGALLFEMTTGQPPFVGESPIAVVLQHIKSPVPSPQSKNPLIPIGLEQIILRALEKEPANRYAEAGEMVEDLEILLSDRGLQLSEARRSDPRVEEISVKGFELMLLDYGTLVPLTGKDRYVLGRLDGAFEPDLDLEAYGGAAHGVSRLHAEIEVSAGGRVSISDIESTNGTWVNGKQISSPDPMSLKDGDLISLGRCRLQIRFLR